MNTNNSCNRKSKKTVKSDLNLFDLYIPREREGSFEPQIVKKY
nr:transposase [Clostridium perfringens]